MMQKSQLQLNSRDMDALYLFLACLAGTVGMGWLALSQARNWRAVMTGSMPGKVARWFRIAGWSAIFASLILCILRDGGSFAVILWPLILAVSAFVIAMALTYKPAVLKVLHPNIR